ncbi:head-tail connector protein [Kurthia populi]|uniref:Head-tail connector protein n=1 Tax=Kurthia populi TaxID=1562132 RepID=A0ABW5Y246_9BACL
MAELNTDLSSLELLKNSMRVEWAEDDGLIKGLLTAAESYISNAVAGDKLEEMKKDEIFKIATSMLTQYWYKNREYDARQHVPAYITSFIQQLRGKY